MTSFFKELISLGEEDKTSATPARDDRDKMSADELRSHLQRVEEALAAKQAAYDELRSDSLKLQSEYDAYKRKVDGWQRQMKEARAADRKMIEDLRAAGATGKTDDVFVKQTQETINSLKESLREAHEETERAYKKQREAEQQRVAIDEDRKRELAELTQRFEAYKDMTRQQNEKSVHQLEELRQQLSGAASVETLKSSLETSERKRQALQNRCRSLEEEVIALRQQNATSAAPAVASKGAGGEAAAASESGANAGGDGPADVGETPQRSRAAAASSSASMTPSSVVVALEAELAQAQALLAATQAKEAEATERARKLEDRLQRQQEDAQWEALQAEKKLSECRSLVESWKTKHAMVESKLDAAREDHAAAEKAVRKALRDVEDSLKQEREAAAALQREVDRKRREVEDLLQQQREHASQRSALTHEAEEASRKTAEALDVQRRHFEDRQAQLEEQLQRAYGEAQALAASLQEQRDDSRRLEDALADARRELETRVALVADLEDQLAASQRALSDREQDLLTRERERHRIRAQLRDEEDAAARHKATVAELQERLGEAEHEGRRRDAQVRQLEADVDRNTRDLTATRASLEEARAALAAKERLVGELTARLRDQGVRNADIVKIREDQSAKVRYYESRVLELQEELRQANSRTVGGNAGPSAISTANESSSMTSVGETFALRIQPALSSIGLGGLGTKYRGLSWSQLKRILAVTVAFILLISIVNTFNTASSSKGDVETIEILREKYGQTLASVTSCRESLAEAKSALLTCTSSAAMPAKTAATSSP